MKTLCLILTISLLTSCREKARDGEERWTVKTSFLKDTQLELDEASIQIPKGWKQLSDESYPQIADATSRYRFRNKNGKMIILEYGLSAIGNPAEPSVIPARWRERYIRFRVDTAKTMFDDNPELAEIRKRGPYTFSILNVSNFRATYYQPKQNGNGFIGISIDSIGEIADNLAGLTFYAKDLDSLETQEMIKVIKSLRLHEFN
jgi:hypothetical protein